MQMQKYITFKDRKDYLVNQERQEAIRYIQTGEPSNYKIDFTQSLLMIDIIRRETFYQENWYAIYNLLLKHPIIAESFVRVTLWQTRKEPQDFFILDVLLTQEHPIFKNIYMWIEILEAASTLDENHDTKLQHVLWRHRYVMHMMILHGHMPTDDIEFTAKINIIAQGKSSLLHTLLCLQPKMMLYLSNPDINKNLIPLMERYPQCHKILCATGHKKPETEADKEWCLQYHLLGYDFLLSESFNDSFLPETTLYI